MKKYLILAVLFMASVLNVSAQSEEAALTKTINDFLEGGTNGEIERFRGAFVKDAVQKTIGNSGVVGMTVESLISKIKPNQKMDRTTKIVSISYANNAATAITETEYSTNKIIDLLNLLKVGDEWKIVSRVYSRITLEEEVQTVGEQKGKAPAKATPPAPKPKKPVVSNDGW